MVAFLKGVYGRAKEADKFLIATAPRHTWNTMVALSIWDMRLSIACATTDAEYQNRILRRENTRRPHPDPHHAAHTATRLVVAAKRT